MLGSHRHHHQHAGQDAGRRGRRLHLRPARRSSIICGSARGRICSPTPLPPPIVMAALKALELVAGSGELRDRLHANARQLRAGLEDGRLHAQAGPASDPAGDARRRRPGDAAWPTSCSNRASTSSASAFRWCRRARRASASSSRRRIRRSNSTARPRRLRKCAEIERSLAVSRAELDPPNRQANFNHALLPATSPASPAIPWCSSSALRGSWDWLGWRGVA